jgi:hypothetical protein
MTRSKRGCNAGVSRPRYLTRLVLLVTTLAVMDAGVTTASMAVVVNRTQASSAPSGSSRDSAARSLGDGSTVWLCRPGLSDNSCTSSLTSTVVQATGATAVVKTNIATNSPFDCFYVYPTVSRSFRRTPTSKSKKPRSLR